MNKLSQEQIEWLKENYHCTKNDIIAKKFGVHRNTILRMAKNLGLSKSDDFIAECRKRSLGIGRAVCRDKNYPPKGYKVPNRERNRFKKGVSCSERYGADRAIEIAKKISKTRSDLYRLESARARFGLPRQTKLNISKSTRKQQVLRHYLKKKLGYIVGDNGFVFYYDESTKRSAKIESKQSTGFRFLPLTQLTQ